jgi:hypothetical protein
MCGNNLGADVDSPAANRPHIGAFSTLPKAGIQKLCQKRIPDTAEKLLIASADKTY